MKFAEFKNAKGTRIMATIRVPHNLYALVKVMAKKRNVSINQLITAAITEFITK
jgi:predicted HicB family RNase H-like nuclease